MKNLNLILLATIITFTACKKSKEDEPTPTINPYLN